MEKRTTTPGYADLTPITTAAGILVCILPAFFPMEGFQRAVWEHIFFPFTNMSSSIFYVAIEFLQRANYINNAINRRL